MSSLEITEVKNKHLDIFNTPSNLDKPLAPDIPDPLPANSGFAFGISGPSGSGKTTLLTSIMSARKKNGKRQSYRKVFDHIIIVSPTLGQGKSAKKDVFADIKGEQKFKHFNNASMQEIFNMIEENREEGEHTCLILDDVGSQLRKNATAEKMLTGLIQNRRHLFCSIFILLQKFKDMPTGIRNNLSHFITFRPKNLLEQEAICSEMMPFHRKHHQTILDFCFENEDKHSFLMIDMSLKENNKFRYFRRFNEIIITEK